jgi:DNA-binding PadR family transcriptional regulator
MRGKENREALTWVVERIHLLGLRSGIETDILRELVSGRRTTKELVSVIFDEDPESSTYESHYAKIRRALKPLKAKGLITCSLFGREKIYRLTRHGELTLVRIAVGYPEQRLIGRASYGLFLITFVLGLFSIIGIKFTGGLAPAISATFFVFLGASLLQTVLVLREVV